MRVYSPRREAAGSCAFAKDNFTPQAQKDPVNAGGYKGFTLIELLVVIGIIALALAIVLPGMTSLFRISAETQARAMFSGMCGQARALAVESQTNVLIHSQIGLDGKSYILPMMLGKDNAGNPVYKMVPGYTPQAVPGGIAYGEVLKFMEQYGNGYRMDAFGTDAQLDDFTTFNVVFNNEGTLWPFDGVVLDKTASVFAGTADQKIWDGSNAARVDESSTSIITLFDFVVFKSLPDSSTRATWLGGIEGDPNHIGHGTWIGINYNTGHVLPTK